MKRPLIWTFGLGLILSILLSISTFSFAQGNWAKKGRLLRSRGSLTSAVVDGRIYAIGGFPFNPAPTLEEYNLQTNRWTEKQRMPRPRYGASASVADGRIYVIGGVAEGQGIKSAGTVEAYDPATDTWTLKQPMPTPRQYLTTAAVNGKIYAIGGIVFDAENDVWVILETVEAYDPQTDTWEKKRDLPQPRGWLGSGVVDNKIYAIGGADPAGALATVVVYNPETNRWDKGEAPMQAHRFVFDSVSVVGQRIYVIGGMDGAAEMLSTVEIYHPDKGEWTIGTAMPTPRAWLTTAVLNGKIYAVGGSKTGAKWTQTFPTVEVYDPEGDPNQPFAVSPKEKLAITWGKVKGKVQ